MGGAVAYAQEATARPIPYLRELMRDTPVRPNDEIRALWVVRDALTSAASIDRCIDLAVLARFHLLFVQVRGRGDAYYQSSLEPEAPDLIQPISDFDPLQYLLIRAHEAGLSVHAWVNVFYVWSNGGTEPPPGHVVLEHPDWLVTDDTGTRMDERPVADWQAEGIEGYYVSPWRPEVRKHTAEVVRDLVYRYPLDGIHLDYIRYPGRRFGYPTGARTEFELIWGVDPLDVTRHPDELQQIVGPEFAARLDTVVVDWRAAQVDSMVLTLRDAAGGLPLSAAVVPDAEIARVDKGQDWVRWVHERMVDFVVPMAYNYQPEEILPWLRVLHNTVGREHALVGLAIHDGRDRYLARSINLLRTEHAEGFCIFSYNVLSERRFAAQFLEEVFFPEEEEVQEEE